MRTSGVLRGVDELGPPHWYFYKSGGTRSSHRATSGPGDDRRHGPRWLRVRPPPIQGSAFARHRRALGRHRRRPYSAAVARQRIQARRGHGRGRQGRHRGAAVAAGRWDGDREPRPPRGWSDRSDAARHARSRCLRGIDLPRPAPRWRCRAPDRRSHRGYAGGARRSGKRRGTDLLARGRFSRALGRHARRRSDRRMAERIRNRKRPRAAPPGRSAGARQGLRQSDLGTTRGRGRHGAGGFGALEPRSAVRNGG